MSKGIAAASSSERRQGNGFSNGASRKEHSPPNILILAPKTCLGLLTYRYFCVVLSHKVCVNVL